MEDSDSDRHTDLEGSHTRHDGRHFIHQAQQQPVVAFDSFPVFNLHSNGREGRKLASASFRAQPHEQQVHHNPNRSQSRSSSKLRSRDGHFISDSVFRSDGHRIYPKSERLSGVTYSQSSPRVSSRSSFSSSRPPFYPSPKVVHGPESRDSTRSYSFPKGFRDFHETFYGKKGNKKVQSRRHQDYKPVDNSLLGSGNFEVLSGGTFYGNEKKSRHPYDSHLDGEYSFDDERDSYFQPHDNYVDDFFSNFRDFSEFAARRSDRDDFFGHGTDNVEHILPPNRRFRSHEKPKDLQTSDSNPHVQIANPPRNIQEVMKQIESQSSNSMKNSLSVEEKDPMIAIF